VNTQQHRGAILAAKRIAAIDTSLNGFNSDLGKAHAEAFASLHEHTTSLYRAVELKRRSPEERAFVSSLRAKRQADTGAAVLGLRSSNAAEASRLHFAAAKRLAIAAILHLAERPAEQALDDGPLRHS